MKTQMRFQKILSLVTLIVAALCFVFTMAFLTGGMGNVHYYIDVSGTVVTDKINALNFFNAAQSFVDGSLILSIIFILAVAVVYATATNSRRNYYVTNYVAVGIVVVAALVITIYSFIGISNVMNLFYNDIAWESGTNGGNNYAEKFNEQYPLDKSALSFVLGYILYAIVVVDVVAWVLNLIWKIKLMKGEKALLKEGFVKEAA